MTKAEIVKTIAVVLEGERTFCLTAGQVLEAVNTIHFHFAVPPLNSFLRGVVGKFYHVVFEFGTASSPPEDVGVTIRC